MCRVLVLIFQLFGIPLRIWHVRLRKRYYRGEYFTIKLKNSINNTWTEKREEEKEIMESNYDEDLNDNIFFQQLQNEYSAIFQKSISEGWILCVPRSGSFSRGSLLEEDFLGQILVPSDELPVSHFRTLTGKEVRLCNRVLTVDYDIAKPCATHILFEETFYTQDLVKYKIWCVERLLERGSVASPDSISVLTNLRECVDFLWTEILNKQVLYDSEKAVKEFQETHEQLEDQPLHTQRDSVAGLYAKCLGLMLKDSRLREKTASSRHFLHTIKIAVETYVLHGLRNSLPKAISACTAFDDACLNKTIKNLHELQLRDLGVRSDLYGCAVRGKLELARIDGFATVLGKIGCLRRAIRFSSQGESSVSSDDLLPVLIFLVIRAGLPNWIAQLAFMKQFRFSSNSEYETDEAGFLITSLEAAVEHVRSGVLMGSAHPEAEDIETNDASVDKVGEIREEEVSVGYFFTQVKQGNISEVQRILSNKTVEKDRPEIKLCHPLCTCESCEKSLAKDVQFSLPTVHSRDDRGLTALHIAALHGQANMVDLLTDHGSNVDEVDADGTTALHCAAARGHQSILLLLLHANADPTITDTQGNTVLHLAADNGHEPCVKALVYSAEHIRWSVDPNLSNCNGDTPLHFSSKWGYTGIVEILLEHGAQPRATNRRGQTPLALAHSTKISRLLETAAHKHLFPIPRLVPLQHPLTLMQSTENRDQVEPNYSTERLRRIERLLSAISEGDLRLACYYLGLEGPEQKPVEPAPTFCHPLCTCENCSMIEEIPTEHQKKPALGINCCDGDGRTPLHVACASGRSAFVQSLLDSGAKLSAVTKSRGQSPLHLACLYDQFIVTKILLNSGECDIDIRDKSGDTPLHLACRMGDTRLVELLVRYGASPNIRNLKGITAIEEAGEKCMVGIVQILTGRASISR